MRPQHASIQTPIAKRETIDRVTRERDHRQPGPRRRPSSSEPAAGREHGTHDRARAQRARPVAVAEDLAAAAEIVVDVAGGGDLEALHAARERDAVVGLDDELDAARAHRERDDAKIWAGERHRERAA